MPDKPREEVEREERELASVQDLILKMQLPEADARLKKLEARDDSLNERQRLEVRLQRAICSGRSGDNPNALKAAREAGKLAESLDDSKARMTALRFQGNCLLAMGEHAEAIKAYRENLVMARSAGVEREIAASYNNLGAVYRDIEEYEEAVACFDMARRIHEENGNAEEVHIARVNLATCRMQSGEFTAAESIYEDLLENGSDFEDMDHTLIPLWGLAGIAAKRGDLAKAREQFQKVFIKLEASGQSLMLLEARLDWAEELVRLGKDEDAHELVLELRQDEGLLHRQDLKARCIRLTAEILERIGQYRESLKALKQLREIERDRFRKLSQSRTDAIRIIQQTERAHHLAEIERLKNEELAKALEEADRMRMEAEEANRMKSEILKMAAHDLRNPMGNILSFLELARDESDPPSRELLTARAEKMSADALYLLDRLLDAAAIEEGAIHIAARTFDFPTLLKDLLLHEVKPQLERKKQRLVRGEGPSQLAIEADATRCRQILLNLFSNAIKYSPPGSFIRYRYELLDDRLRFELEDQGPGIPQEKVESIFRPFERLETSIPTGGESSMGLGLSIARRLARAHGGDLKAVSEGLGHGSTFQLTLPLLR